MGAQELPVSVLGGAWGWSLRWAKAVRTSVPSRKVASASQLSTIEIRAVKRVKVLCNNCKPWSHFQMWALLLWSVLSQCLRSAAGYPGLRDAKRLTSVPLPPPTPPSMGGQECWTEEHAARLLSEQHKPEASQTIHLIESAVSLGQIPSACWAGSKLDRQSWIKPGWRNTPEGEIRMFLHKYLETIAFG